MDGHEILGWMDLHAKITGKKEVMAIKIDREDDAERFVDGKDPRRVSLWRVSCECCGGL